MSQSSPLRIAVVPDLGQPLDTDWMRLTGAERDQARAWPTERRRRQYVFGRLAAREAIRGLLEPRTFVSFIEILSESERAPRVSVNGMLDGVLISISHSNRLAVACAWLAHSKNLASAGIDLECLRPNEVAGSTYAFSRAERKLLGRAPEGPEIAALAAWTAKEAVWKALLAGQEIGPNAIEVKQQSLEQSCAVIQVKGPLLKRLGDSRLNVQSNRFEGPGGEYVLSLAQVTRSESRRLIPDRVFKLNLGQTNRLTPSSEVQL
jgi:4'-phosphopantetheinyl transferase EntD